MALFPGSLPWLDKPAAVREAGRMILASGVATNALIGFAAADGPDPRVVPSRRDRAHVRTIEQHLAQRTRRRATGQPRPRARAPRSAAPPRSRRGRSCSSSRTSCRCPTPRGFTTPSRLGGTSFRSSSRTRSGSARSRTSPASRCRWPTRPTGAPSRSGSAGGKPPPADPSTSSAPTRLEATFRGLGLDPVAITSSDRTVVHAAFLAVGRRAAGPRSRRPMRTSDLRARGAAAVDSPTVRALAIAVVLGLALVGGARRRPLASSARRRPRCPPTRSRSSGRSRAPPSCSATRSRRRWTSSRGMRACRPSRFASARRSHRSASSRRRSSERTSVAPRSCARGSRSSASRARACRRAAAGASSSSSRSPSATRGTDAHRRSSSRGGQLQVSSRLPPGAATGIGIIDTAPPLDPRFRRSPDLVAVAAAPGRP